MDAVPQSGRPDASRPGASSPAASESVLDTLARHSGASARVSLRDSEHGETPILDPKVRASDVLPQGRGSYQILGEIARGGMGVILKAHDRDLGRDVALKVLDQRLVSKPGVLQRFVEEAQIGGQLQHPGIVPVYELGLMADERPYFTMKLVKGRTLQALLSRRKTLDEERLRYLSIFEDVCQTMAYAHSKGVIHRDLKPANVMVGAFGEVQVVDWGLSKVLRQGGVADEERARKSDLTVIETVRSGPGTPGTDSQVGSVLGTPAYMPPEQARGEIDALDERADVFALGAILCEILSGKPPYVDAPDATAVQQAARARLDPARERLASSGAGPELVELCLSCLSAAPQARPANAEELARAVHGHLAATEERARRAQVEAAEARARAREERKARRLTLTLAGTLVAALTIGGLGWARIERQERERIDLVRDQIELAREQAYRLQADGLHDQALETMDRARTLTAGLPAGHLLNELVRRSAEPVVERAARARAASEQAARDERLLTRLSNVGILQDMVPTDQGKAQLEELDQAYAQAFLDWGLDLEGDLVASLDELRASGMGAELALSLDDWARLRRARFGPETNRADGLTSLAADLDPDPKRLELRDALLERDSATLLALAESAQVRELPPSTLWMLAKALVDLERPVPAGRLLERACGWHPDDYRLRVAAGIACEDRARTDLALDHYTAARGLRPLDPYMDVAVAGMLGECGRIDEAVPAARAALEQGLHDPSLRAQALFWLGLCSMFLGDYAMALPALREQETIQERDPDNWSALPSTEFFAGEISREELVRVFSEHPRRNQWSRFVLAMSLAAPPEGIEADPLEALKILEPDAALGAEFGYFGLATAHLALGHPEETLRYCSAHTRASRGLFNRRDVTATVAAMRAHALALKGDVDSARAWLEVAQNEYALLSEQDPGAWERTRFAQFLRRAEAALEGR